MDTTMTIQNDLSDLHNAKCMRCGWARRDHKDRYCPRNVFDGRILHSLVDTFIAYSGPPESPIEELDEFSRPAHYVAGRKYETWDIIIDWDLDYLCGNVIKYISRCGRKGDKKSDLLKAKKYIEKALEGLDNEVTD